MHTTNTRVLQVAWVCECCLPTKSMHVGGLYSAALTRACMGSGCIRPACRKHIIYSSLQMLVNNSMHKWTIDRIPVHCIIVRAMYVVRVCMQGIQYACVACNIHSACGSLMCVQRNCWWVRYACVAFVGALRVRHVCSLSVARVERADIVHVQQACSLHGVVCLRMHECVHLRGVLPAYGMCVVSARCMCSVRKTCVWQMYDMFGVGM
jgi:hypothetical protein